MRMNCNMTEGEIKEICSRINEQPFVYIPKINKKFFDFKKTLDEMQKTIMETMNKTNEENSSLNESDIKANKFLLDTLKREMDILKFTFTDQKSKKIEESFFKIREIEEQMRIVNIKTKSIITANELE